MIHTGLKNGFTFDAVQMPLNVMDAHYRSFAERVVPVLVRHGIGVLGMKPLGNGIILQSHTATPIECLHYAMNLPTSVVINGCESLERLHQGLQAARTFRPLTKKEVAAILAKTAVAAAQGGFEPFKTTHDFDGTYHHPQWLG
jgi:predicted aldo/keto reductase-like oxidoreductase